MTHALQAETPALDPSSLQPGDGARARLSRLLDPDSFVELGSQRQHRANSFGLDRRRPDSDGVVCGTGEVAGRAVNVYAQDRRVLGGSLGEAHADKIARAIDQAARGGVPVVGINDSGGARIQEGVAALDGYGHVFSANVRASGVVPQIAMIMGPCAGGATYSPALMDFVVMTDEATMFLTGPRVVKAVTGEDVDARALGGPEVHGRRSGVAHFLCRDDDHAIAVTQELLGYLPSSCNEPVPQSCPARPGRRRPARDRPDRRPTALRRPGRHRRARRRRRLPRGPARVGQEPRRRARAHRRPHGRHRRQPGQVARRRARPDRVGEGRAVRALLRRVRHPAGRARRRPRVPPRHRAGVRRRHPQGRQAPARRSPRRRSRASAWSCARPSAAATS